MEAIKTFWESDPILFVILAFVFVVVITLFCYGCVQLTNEEKLLKKRQEDADKKYGQYVGKRFLFNTKKRTFCGLDRQNVEFKYFSNLHFPQEISGKYVSTYIQVEVDRFEARESPRDKICCILIPVETSFMWSVIFKSSDFVIIQNEVYGEVCLPFDEFREMKLGERYWFRNEVDFDNDYLYVSQVYAHID